jgi:predicted metal-dependent HD superfamily phosphohydrolase
MLLQEFTTLVWRHTTNSQLAARLWKEVEEAYTRQERYYHTLSHLEQMFKALSPFQSVVEDWDTLLFSLFYHDIVYQASPTAESNEALSAKQAEAALAAIFYPPGKIKRCSRHILGTQKHERSLDNDTNLLTDADLSILGQEWTAYEAYSRNIRKEYSTYPDLIYQAGRRQVLHRFLQMSRIYKTEPFYSQYERIARENIKRELALLAPI